MILTASFYQFVALPDCAERQAPLLACCEAQRVLGNILLAGEGINGSIAGPAASVRAVLDFLCADPHFSRLQLKTAASDRQPFYRLKVRVKEEIVTMGVPGLDPERGAGNYVAPADWNALIAKPGLVLIDVRNAYEIGIGSFQGAVDPGTASFTDWPQWVQAQQAPGGLLAGKPEVAMFCTGGIRCEKASTYLRAQGFDQVHHLEGGILRYLESVPAQESRWQGECFVFDERVAVGQGLAPGTHELCRSCRHPLGPQDIASPQFVRGVSCARCAGERTPAQQRGYLERQRQVELAAARGQAHVGARLPTAPQGKAATE